MSAYVVFIRDNTLNDDEMAIYAEKAGQARGDHPITPLAFYGELETLEGQEAEGVVILEFPTREAAHAWYDSPEYQAAKVHRLKGANYRAILVQGVDK
ncbi:hypothetical protein HA41_19580 [Pantoea conspicua]|uniref:DUF1330 domain-containing protein n=1 Tax=Pantoea conspicua TaxID=472705 RepID=A0A1X1BQW7_9GAMM|nr:DUF1330 domain-containing protein [Pantoea conspicua]ORM50479.1 hypothetical protein HA41_19580 [Pantoea conspicua]